MAIATCPVCRTNFNASKCPRCQRPADFDERFEIDVRRRAAKLRLDKYLARKREVSGAAEERFSTARMLTESRAKSAGPIGITDIWKVQENLRWARVYLGDHEGCDEAHAALGVAIAKAEDVERKLSRELLKGKAI